MIIQEKQPIIIHDSDYRDWSAANTIISLVVIAVLGFVVYYFAVMQPAATRIETTTTNTAPAAAPMIIHDAVPVPMQTAAPAAPTPVMPQATAPAAQTMPSTTPAEPTTTEQPANNQ